MTVLDKVVRRLRKPYLCILRFYLEKRFRCWEGALLGKLELAGHITLQVPLRSGGSGYLYIGRGNSMGYWAAPLVGDGSITLQPRERGSVVRIGDGNRFSNNVNVIACERIEIGDGCQIGDGVAIYDSDFHEIDPLTRNQSTGPSAPVVIGNNVWLGSRVMILKGVSIGDNSVIGAMSLVTKSIPANCIAAGNPAKVLRSIER